MTWAFAEVSQLLTVFFATLKSFKLLKAISLNEEEDFFENEELLTDSQDALIFWSVFAVWRIYLYIFERWFRWIPGYYYFKALYILLIAFPQLRILHVVFYDIIAPSVARLEQEVLKYEKYFTYAQMIDFAASLPFIIIFILCPWIADDPSSVFKGSESVDLTDEKLDTVSPELVSPESYSLRSPIEEEPSSPRSYSPLRLLSRIASRFTSSSKKESMNTEPTFDGMGPYTPKMKMSRDTIDAATPMTPEVYSKMMDSKRRLSRLTSKYDILENVSVKSDRSRKSSSGASGSRERTESSRWNNMMHGRPDFTKARAGYYTAPRLPSSRYSLFEMPTAKKYIRQFMRSSTEGPNVESAPRERTKRRDHSLERRSLERPDRYHDWEVDYAVPGSSAKRSASQQKQRFSLSKRGESPSGPTSASASALPPESRGRPVSIGRLSGGLRPNLEHVSLTESSLHTLNSSNAKMQRGSFSSVGSAPSVMSFSTVSDIGRTGTEGYSSGPGSIGSTNSEDEEHILSARSSSSSGHSLTRSDSMAARGGIPTTIQRDANRTPEPQMPSITLRQRGASSASSKMNLVQARAASTRVSASDTRSPGVWTSRTSRTVGNVVTRSSKRLSDAVTNPTILPNSVSTRSQTRTKVPTMHTESVMINHGSGAPAQMHNDLSLYLGPEMNPGNIPVHLDSSTFDDDEVFDGGGGFDMPNDDSGHDLSEIDINDFRPTMGDDLNLEIENRPKKSDNVTDMDNTNSNMSCGLPELSKEANIKGYEVRG